MIWMMALTQLIGFIPILVFGGLGVNDITAMYLYSLLGVRQELVAPIVIAARIYLYLLNISLLPYLALGEASASDNESGPR